MKAIQMTTTGGPEVLEWTEVPDPDPGPTQVVVDVEAAGLNFIDTYHRTGLYPMTLPLVPGLEGAGTISAIGNEVDDLTVGDRVAWSSGIGSYAQRVAVSAAHVVPVPEDVSSDVAAASMLQGLTAHYLAIDTYPLEQGSKCLIHAGAGGVGLLLIQIAKMQGAEVFTTVGSTEKAELARAAGADHVILYRDVDFGDAVEEVAGPHALDVVYDGVGQTVFDRSLELLRLRGMLVQFGNASGAVEPVSPLRLSRGGSLFLTRPTLFHYVSTRPELMARASDLFAWIGSGALHVRIGATFPMSDAAEAHRALEARKTTGKVLLTPPE
ncbi:MAG TPA: quinone oxidoreductase [Acidimicrobiia bacterium]|nr:quinone oxidoreductase [Acidimicrobiia bacterium]